MPPNELKNLSSEPENVFDYFVCLYHEVFKRLLCAVTAFAFGSVWFIYTLRMNFILSYVLETVQCYSSGQKYCLGAVFGYVLDFSFRWVGTYLKNNVLKKNDSEWNT